MRQVKQLYDQLELKAEFERFEEPKYRSIVEAIESLSLPLDNELSAGGVQAVRCLLVNFVGKITSKLYKKLDVATGEPIQPNVGLPDALSSQIESEFPS